MSTTSESDPSSDTDNGDFEFALASRVNLLFIPPDAMATPLPTLVAQALLHDQPASALSAFGDLEPGYELEYHAAHTTDSAPVNTGMPEAPTLGIVYAPGLSRTQKKNARKRRKKAHKLATANWRTLFAQYKIRLSLSKKHAAIMRIQTALMLLRLPACKGCFVARNIRPPQSRNPTYVKWDGRSMHALAASDGTHNRVVALLGGRPDDPSWDEDCATLFARTVQLRKDLILEAKHRNAMRGRQYEAIHIGASFGGGQEAPGILVQTEHNKPLIAAYVQERVVRRIVSYTNYCFALGAPLLFKSFVTELDKLYAHYPTLQPPFLKSVWPTFSINFPPRAYCNLHTDFKNRPIGWCSIFSGGSYDPACGGQLRLPQLNLVIEFPPNSVILLPSAVLKHGNRALAPGPDQQRFVITQYAPGGLFRHVRYDFRTEAKVKKEDPEFWQDIQEENTGKWEREVKLWSVIGDLHRDRVTAGIVEDDAQLAE